MVRPRDRASQAAPCPAGIHRSPRSAAMTFAELSGYLDRLESTSSRNELVKTLADLYAKSSPDEIQPLTYLIQGRLVPFFEPVEIGLGEKLVIAAIAQAFGMANPEVAKLFGRVGDLGQVAAQLAGQTPSPSLPVTAVHIRLMEIALAAGAGSVEKKRSLFAALLKEADPASAKHLVRMALGRLRLGIGDPTVLDALSFAKKGDKSLRPVLEAAYNRVSDLGLTASRRRQHGIEQAAQELPLVAFVFDILYRNGRDLTELPYEERLAMVDEVIAGSSVLLPAPIIKTDSVDVLTKTLLDSISQGLEGVVVKRPDSKYQAGARNFNWVKLKRHTSGELNDTIDLVLLGYYFGKGKRADFGLGALLGGVYDADNDKFASITKLGTGLSDAEWRQIHERADKLQVDQRPARVDSILVPDVWLKPEVVVEVMADEITPSPRHTAGKVDDQPGFALRFPRVVSFRGADKRAEDATTVKEVADLFRQQRERKQPA